MIYQRLSPRQNLAMTWWNRPGFEDYDGIICDGSIRSGKTVAMTVGFVMWAMRRFQGQNFALCGKTIESLRRNVTSNLPNWLAGVFSFREYRTENKIVVTAAGRSNNFYLFGGRDESALLSSRASPWRASCWMRWPSCPLLCGAGLCPLLCGRLKALV